MSTTRFGTSATDAARNAMSGTAGNEKLRRVEDKLRDALRK